MCLLPCFDLLICTVDCEVEEDNFDAVAPSPSSLSPPPPLLRPQVSDRSPSPSLTNRPKLRPPLPPPKSTSNSPHGYDESALYEDPNLVEFSNQYSSDGLTEDLYDCRISDKVLQKLNTEPPPVWKNPANSTPPPLPPTRHSRRFTKSLQMPSSNRDLPPPLPYRSSRDEPPLSTKKLPKVPKLPSPFVPKANKPRPANNRATTPPAMPLAPNFKADLGSKLKQRQNMTRSWSEDEQLPYEDMDYSIESNQSEREFSPRSRSKSEETTESDTGSYVDCDPNEPQSYLDYSQASSMFRNDPQPNGRDWSPMPLPLPPRATIAPAASISDDDDDESAPPVPRRHPQSSGRSLPKQLNSGRFSPHGVINNLLPLPPRSKSPIPEDDDAPPVPARGPESTRPPLNRPHSEKHTNALLPLPSSRGISVPAGGTRLPMPLPPKFVIGHIETNDNDIFQKVNFDKNHRDNSPVPKEPKQNIQPSWKTGDVSNRSSDNKPNRYPLPIPKSTIPKSTIPSKLAPSPKPLTSASKPKPTPPPVTNKPKSPKHSSFDSSSTDSGVSQVQRNIDAMNRSSAGSPRIKKKLPDPTLSNGTETRSKLDKTGIKKGPSPAPKNPGLGKKIPDLTETRRKLADPSFLSKLSEQTSNPPGFKPTKTLPDSPAPYSPETRRKYPNGIQSTTRVPHLEHRSRPEIAKKPPPTPKEKPVLSKFQNRDLAACLQSNNNPSSRRPPGASSHKPVAPLKPKPLLPPSYR